MKTISGLLMIISGIALTCASAWFGINGLLIFFPEKELYYGVLFLGIALEIAKVFTAVFLFHYVRDTKMPKVIKTYMGVGVVVLIFISAVATYVHLSYYVAGYIKKEEGNSSQISRLNSELDNNRKEREYLDKQIAALPSDYVKGRISLMNKFERRKKQIDAREEEILNKLNTSEVKTEAVSEKSKEYAFLDYMSSSFGKSRQTIYNALILLLVIVLDPLAIFLTLSGTYIFTTKFDTIEPIVENRDNEEKIERFDSSSLEERILKLEETLNAGLDRLHELHIKSNGETYPVDIESLQYNLDSTTKKVNEISLLLQRMNYYHPED